MRKLNPEDRLVRRITNLRTLLCYTEEPEIVMTLREFITETEDELGTLWRPRTRTTSLH
jgi:hypothetical protein